MNRPSLSQLLVVPILLALFTWAVAQSPKSGTAETSKDAPKKSPTEEGLVGYWTLRGDCQDHSGHNNHGINRGVKLEDGTFDGEKAYIEIPNSKSLNFGTGDFAISARIHTEAQVNDILGDVLDKFDPDQRRGITLSLKSSAGGYQSQGTDRQVFFGIDNAKTTDWVDCGHPSPTCNYINNSLTTFQGKLYAATMEAKDEKDWRHVFRFDGDGKWTDCGQVGDSKTTGVGPLIVHEGHLYAVTSTYDWTRIQSPAYGPGRVYRYGGGTTWIDCGQPSENKTLNCAASYKGKLYVGGGPGTWAVYVQDGEKSWKESRVFAEGQPHRCFPHTMCCYNNKLYVGWPSVHAFDGNEWTYAGIPAEPEGSLQTHSLTVYQGHLVAGTWPLAKVSRYLGGDKWEPFGRIGEDGTEVNALVVYNGKLYGGSIPRAEVCRHETGDKWTTIKQFYSPEGWTPVPPGPNGGKPTRKQVAEWTRVTSLTIQDGKLFASIGSCTSSVVDSPVDVRGKVFYMEAGKCVSYDNDIGSGWKHLVAVRRGDKLKLYVDGKLVASSTAFNPSDYDLSNDEPLRIGFGQTDYFNGKINDLRIYNRALPEPEIAKLAAK